MTRTLSNTAVPVHYAAFREKVLSGEIPVCQEISLEMQRIDELIKRPDVFYDPGAIDGWCEFVEVELTLTDGEKVHLLDSFKLWAEQLLSWFVYKDLPRWDEESQSFIKKRVLVRLRDTQYLIVARGSAKSMYVAFLQAYFLTVDPATTHQVTLAPTMRQAEEVMSPIRTAIQRSEGPLFKMLTFGSKQNTTGNPALRQQLSSTKKGIELFATNSLLEVRPMSIDKVQGLRTKYNSVDEWLSGDTRENVITALMQGARKFEDPILVAISSEGTIRNGVGDDIKLELAAILRGELQEDNVSIFHYKLDNVQEVGKPEKWLKCNPNLGITVSYETYKQDVEKAELFPHIRNEILAKRFGLPMEGTTYFFTYEETLPTFATVHPTRYSGMECCLGIDLSRGDDFCAFTFLFPLGQGRFGLKTRSYISRRTLDLLSGSKRIKYESFREEGTLIVLEGNTLDMMEVYDDLFDHVEQLEYIVVAVGYDVYNADAFIERWERDNGPQGIYKVPQGARTESVPLGEMKTQVAAKVVEFDEKIMLYTMGHAVAKEDLNGNRMLVKLRNEEKIDNVSAWMDAYVAYKRDPEMFD
jgi:phage terminase large subunit-like protein